MKIHKKGFGVITVFFLLLAAILLVFNYFFPVQTIIHYLLYVAATIFYFLIIRFFRVPSRSINIDENAIYCPADGTIVIIEEVEESEYFNDRRKQVSIFMSPLNVHINFFPISGIVKYYKYHKGKFLVAWHPKSSTLNERNTIVVEHKSGKSILFRQIAGFVARRIVCPAKVNDIAVQGNEFGLIKFGSRVDVFLPLDAKVNVSLEQKVTAKKTVLAYFS